MTSRRGLEEEIAREKDPIVRKQLQELLDKRQDEWEKSAAKKIEDTAKSVGRNLSNTLTSPSFWKEFRSVLLTILKVLGGVAVALLVLGAIIAFIVIRLNRNNNY